MVDRFLLVSEALRCSITQLRVVSDSARLDAELLLQSVLGCDRTWPAAHGDHVLDETQANSYADLVKRRCTGEPIAYILKEKEFWSLSLQISPAVLIPRTETELLVEQALQSLVGVVSPVILDLGTGSGAVVLALLHERPDARAVAVDRSPSALRIAQWNAKKLGLVNSVGFLQSDWFSGLAPPMRYDLIVSNPPYVVLGDPELDEGVRRFEPTEALYSGKNGLADLERIIVGSGEWLKEGGILLTEHGASQADAVRGLFHDSNYSMVRTWNDLSGRPRVSGGRFE